MSANAGEAKTVSLSEYLDLANQSGFNIIYSSDLLSSRYKVTFDQSITPTLTSVKKALAAYSLSLQPVGTDNFVVIKQAPSEQQAPRQTQTLPPLEDESANNLEEVIVSSSLYRLYSDAGSLRKTLNAEILSSRAVTANDATRLVNQLPGSASVGVSARPRVRGGNENETLFLFDGIRLYNPFHFNRFNSLFSSFDNRILSSIDFFSGGYPVSIGDRSSAAMLINTKDSSELGDRREIGAGLYNVSYLQNIDADDHSLLVNVRRSNLELINSLTDNDFGTPSFSDAYIRYRRELADDTSGEVNLLYFGDDIEINTSDQSEETESHYRNVYLWGKLKNTYDDNTTRTSWFGVAQSLNDRSGSLDHLQKVTATIKDDQTFRFLYAGQSFEHITPLRLYSFGWDYRFLKSEYQYQSEQVVNPEFASLSNINRAQNNALQVDERGHQAAGYFSIKQQLSRSFLVEVGLRVDAQDYGGPQEGKQKDTQISLRSGLVYHPTDALSFRLSAGRYSQSQGIHELDIADLETQFQAPQHANHFIFGVEFSWFEKDIDLNLDAFRKRATDTRSYFQNLTNPYTLIPELQVDRFKIEPTGYDANGVELSLNGVVFGTQWWFNYSYSSAKDKLPGKNIRRSWDQERTANLGFHKDIGHWGWNLSSSFNEGWLTTPLRQTSNGIVADERNSERFDHFVSVNIKGTRQWTTKRGDIRLEIGLTNLLDRDNQIGVNYELITDEADNDVLVNTPERGLPMAPFLDFYWSF
ncbi:MAG: TonB-dependent receptor plug domain-containing protein [Pseudohongiellaceae bacterium]